MESTDNLMVGKHNCASWIVCQCQLSLLLIVISGFLCLSGDALAEDLEIEKRASKSTGQPDLNHHLNILYDE